MSKFMRNFTSMIKSGVETLFAPAEDPTKTFSDPWQRQQELLGRVQGALAQNTALRKHLERRIARLQAKLPQLEETTRQAVTAKRDDMARLALQQRQLALIELKSLEANVREVQLEEQRISIIEQRLTAQVEALRIRQEMSAARYTAAESQAIVHEVINGFSKELADLGQNIELTERKTEHLQAQANAMQEFVDFAALDVSGESTSDPLERQLVQLDIDTAVSEELAKIKRQLNG